VKEWVWKDATDEECEYFMTNDEWDIVLIPKENLKMVVQDH